MLVIIDRIKAEDIDAETFKQKYYIPERPVIIEYGKDFAKGFWSEATWNRLREKGDVNVNTRWLDCGDSTWVGEFTNPPVPDIINHCRNDTALKKERWMRLWNLPKGACARFHYDFEMKHILIFQGTGRKRWTLVDPRTPIPNLFLSDNCPHYITPENIDSRKYNVSHFDCFEGDFLFLPRLYAHAVESLDEVNVTMNWVIYKWSHPTEAAMSALFKREAQIATLVRHQPFKFLYWFLGWDYARREPYDSTVREEGRQYCDLLSLLGRVATESRQLPYTFYMWFWAYRLGNRAIMGSFNKKTGQAIHIRKVSNTFGK